MQTNLRYQGVFFLNDKDFYSELKYILKGSCILNIIIYLISLVFTLNISVMLGLLLGSVVLFINLHLLRRNLDTAVEFGSNRLRLMSGYLLRYFLLGSAFYFAVKLKSINEFCVIVPQLYPKVLYTLLSVRNNSK